MSKNFTDLRNILSDIRYLLPRPKPYMGKNYRDFKFKDNYKENRFFGASCGCTHIDVKCHMLAGKFDVLEIDR